MLCVLFVEGVVVFDLLVCLVFGEGVLRVLVYEGFGMLLLYCLLFCVLGEGWLLLGLVVYDSDVYLVIFVEYFNVCFGCCYVEVFYGVGLCEVDLFGYCFGGLVVLEIVKFLV